MLIESEQSSSTTAAYEAYISEDRRTTHHLRVRRSKNMRDRASKLL